MKVAIIIINWNGIDDTKECLESLGRIRDKGLDVEVIVVDNGSTDDSVSKLSKLPYKFVLIQSKENLGFAGGNNLGIKHAINNGADYVLALNNDTIVDKNFLFELVKVAEENPKAGLVTSKIYFAKGYEFHKDRYKKGDLGKVIWSAGGDIDWNNVYGTNHGVDEVDSGQFDEIVETGFASGASVLIRVKALKKVGLFNEKYYLYLEDLELSMRMKKHRWKVLYAPTSIVWHKVSQSSGIGSGLNDYYTTRNRLLFGMKYASLRAKIALFRESIKMLLHGRKWQKIGVMDYYIGNLGKGSWQ